MDEPSDRSLSAITLPVLLEQERRQRGALAEHFKPVRDALWQEFLRDRGLPAVPAEWTPMKK